MNHPSVDLINYYCAECNGEDWNLKIGHCEDGRTFLYVCCANPDCQYFQHEKFDLETSDNLIWDSFDITGQGHDPQDIVMGGILDPQQAN